jgi:hypothetical protein
MLRNHNDLKKNHKVYIHLTQNPQNTYVVSTAVKEVGMLILFSWVRFPPLADLIPVYLGFSLFVSP